MRTPLLLLLLVAACSRTPEVESTSTSPSPSPSPVSSPSPSPSPSISPSPSTDLHWTDPKGWTRRAPSNGMRVAEYLVPRAAGDTEDAELVVSTFGGGNVGDNIDRWIRQFDPKASSPFTKTERDVAGMHVTVLDMVGSFKGMSMPGAPPSPPRPGYHLRGAIVEVPGGLWFFKMTGPDATVKAATPKLDELVSSLKR